MLNGKLLYTMILEVNLLAFTYRLFHEDFSSIIGGVGGGDANKLTSRIIVHVSPSYFPLLVVTKSFIKDIFKSWGTCLFSVFILLQERNM